MCDDELPDGEFRAVDIFGTFIFQPGDVVEHRSGGPFGDRGVVLAQHWERGPDYLCRYYTVRFPMLRDLGTVKRVECELQRAKPDDTESTESKGT